MDQGLQAVGCDTPDGQRTDDLEARQATEAARPRTATTTTLPQTEAGAAVAALPALEKMEIAFSGNPPVSSIQPTLDVAMRLYGLPITETNYERAGSVLVVMRRESGFPEMEILDHMIR